MQLYILFVTLNFLQDKISSFFPLRICNFKYIVIWIKQVAHIPIALSPNFVPCLVYHLFHGKPRSNILYLALLLNLNTEPWQLLVVRLFGFNLYYITFNLQQLLLFFSFVITKLPSKQQLIRSSMNVLSTLKLIIILFERNYNKR